MISVTILTKNSQKHIEKVLESLRSFHEVLIYDTGSTDQTLDMAARFPNVKIYYGKFIGFGPTHNAASSAATHDWILSIDSDEIMTPELEKEIQSLDLQPECVYSIRRDNYYRGKWIRWCGWYPERVYRLYHKHQTNFTDAYVHEAVITDGMIHKPLQNAVHHFPYETTADFLEKMQSYSELFAKQNRGKKSSSVWKAIWHGSYAFFKSYFLKRGFMGGAEGFIISVYNGNTAFYKYLKLTQVQKCGDEF